MYPTCGCGLNEGPLCTRTRPTYYRGTAFRRKLLQATLASSSHTRNEECTFALEGAKFANYGLRALSRIVATFKTYLISRPTVRPLPSPASPQQPAAAPATTPHHRRQLRQLHPAAAAAHPPAGGRRAPAGRPRLVALVRPAPQHSRALPVVVQLRLRGQVLVHRPVQLPAAWAPPR